MHSSLKVEIQNFKTVRRFILLHFVPQAEIILRYFTVCKNLSFTESVVCMDLLELLYRIFERCLLQVCFEFGIECLKDECTSYTSSQPEKLPNSFGLTYFVSVA